MVPLLLTRRACLSGLRTEEIPGEDKWGMSYPIGTHVRIRRLGFYHHAIIVGGDAALLSPVMVIDNDKGFGVSRRTLHEVAAGDPVKVVAIPQSPEHAAAIVERAYSQLGAPYDLFGRNCEHFATWCVTGVPRSYQLYNYTAVAGVMSLGLVLTALNAKFRRVPA
ncbi:MAG: hypothetical protein E6K68_04215 [Nitrospirae bacterium]|nr:MAG: hypothetical protein E6K68_04215 [Nitrospirota bacterium]